MGPRGQADDFQHQPFFACLHALCRLPLTLAAKHGLLVRMNVGRWFLVFVALLCTSGCATWTREEDSWQSAVDEQALRLGYRNWIIIAEASFPAYNRNGIKQVTAPVEIPLALDYVMNALERTQHVRPKIYVTRELRALENDYAPGIDEYRNTITAAMHGHQPHQLDQSSLLAIIEDVNQSYNVLVVRTATALPYSSIFLELQPGYWDADAEDHLREHLKQANSPLDPPPGKLQRATVAPIPDVVPVPATSPVPDSVPLSPQNRDLPYDDDDQE